MMRRRLAVLVCLMFLACCAAGAQSFTLQQVMSAPFNSQLKAAPAGQRFVWVADQEGRRNLWIAEAGSDGSYAARALTHYDADDGIDVGDIVWTPDGEHIRIYVRGGDLRFPGEAVAESSAAGAGH